MYILLENGCYRRISDGAIIPDDMNNRDRQAVQRWLDAGNVPEIESPSIPVLKAAKQAEIATEADRILFERGAEYGAMERQTWDQQYSEAEDYQTDPQSTVPLLTAIAASRGMDVATLAGRIIANRAVWVGLAGDIVGQRLAYQDALDSSTTVAEVEAIVVEYRLST